MIKDQAWKGIKFLVILGLVSFLVYGVLLFFKNWVEELTALGSSLFLNLLGIRSSWQGNLVFFDSQKAEIAWLCTGSLELALLLGAVLATEDRTWRQRFLGILFSLVTVYIINIVRVGLTLASAIWFGWRFADLIHTSLFKFFLVFAILGVYAIWYLGLARLGWGYYKSKNIRNVNNSQGE